MKEILLAIAILLAFLFSGGEVDEPVVVESDNSFQLELSDLPVSGSFDSPLPTPFPTQPSQPYPVPPTSIPTPPFTAILGTPVIAPLQPGPPVPIEPVLVVTPVGEGR